MSESKKLLMEGVSDAVGFIGGALAGYWIGQLIGWNLFADGYGSASMGAIVLVGLGGGSGLQLARRWRSKQKNDENE
jgi:F0F1-type ATP synthase assembly protein I